MDLGRTCKLVLDLQMAETHFRTVNTPVPDPTGSGGCATQKQIADGFQAYSVNIISIWILWLGVKWKKTRCKHTGLRGSCSSSVWRLPCQDPLIVLVMRHVKQMGQNGGNGAALVCVFDLAVYFNKRTQSGRLSWKNATQPVPRKKPAPPSGVILTVLSLSWNY